MGMSEIENIVADDAYPGVEDLKKLPTAFQDWQRREGIPVHQTFHVEDLRAVELAPWPRYGCNGAFIDLADCHITSAAMIELAPGQTTEPVKHMFESWVYVVDGVGHTTFEQPGHPSGRVEWKKFSLFGPPLNTTYRHHNLDPFRPARLLMVSNAPLIMNLYHNDQYIFENPFVFEDRFRGQNDFFEPTIEFLRPRYLGARVLRTNIIPDVLNTHLTSWEMRGKGARTVHLSMSDNTTAAHVSSFEGGTYKKAHRHGPGAHVIILDGTGYSLLWEEGKERRRVDWREGSLFAPPEWWFHQHFNTGKGPARYLALRRGGSPEHKMKIGMSGGEKAEGPDQIEYEDEDPAIYQEYADELARNGLELKLPRPDYRKA
jgi:hypothetical protein